MSSPHATVAALAAAADAATAAAVAAAADAAGSLYSLPTPIVVKQIKNENMDLQLSHFHS